MNYEPGQTPLGEGLPPFLDQELHRIASAIRTKQELGGGSVLYGDIDNFNLDTTRNDITGFAQGGAWGTQQGSTDPVAGTITILEDGLYNVRATIAGAHANTSNNQSSSLFLAVNAVELPVCVSEIPTNQTNNRSWTFNGSVTFSAGDVLKLRIEATFNAGLFDAVVSSFTAQRVVL